MFGNLTFTTKTALVLSQEFRYEFRKFRPEQRMLFKSMCKEIRKKGGNEIDAACMFMATMATSLSNPREPLSLVYGWVKKLEDLIPKMTVTFAAEVDEARSILLERLSV